jgi:adenylate cyclase
MNAKDRPRALWAFPVLVLAIALALLARNGGAFPGSPLGHGIVPGAAAPAYLAVTGMVTIWIFAQAGLRRAGLFAAAAMAGAAAISLQFRSGARPILDMAGPGLGLAAIFGACVLSQAVASGRKRALLRDAFLGAVDRGTIRRIERSLEACPLAGENRSVTYLVCGMRLSPSFAARIAGDAASYVKLRGRVLGQMMDLVLAEHGMVEQICGEEIRAVWNAPLDDSGYAVHACMAASAMCGAAERLNRGIAADWRLDGATDMPVEIGIGIFTGPAVTGGIRARGRTVYRASGDCIFAAARIQAKTGDYGFQVAVCEATRNLANEDFAFLEVDCIAATRDGRASKIYALAGGAAVRASPKFRALSTFHEHIFRSLRSRRWARAQELIQQCRTLSGTSQKLYDLHLARIAWFEQHPPGADWDGAMRPAVK